MHLLIVCAVVFLGQNEGANVPATPFSLILNDHGDVWSLQCYKDRYFFNTTRNELDIRPNDVVLTEKWDASWEKLKIEKSDRGLVIKRDMNKLPGVISADFTAEPPQLVVVKEPDDHAYWEIHPAKEERVYLRNLTSGKQEYWLALGDPETPRRIFKLQTAGMEVRPVVLKPKKEYEIRLAEEDVGK